MSFYALHSKQMALPGGIRDATVIIQDGLISGIEEGLVTGMEAGFLDVADKGGMPGVIDPHVHINEPGRTDWEGYDTATRSALAGGLTTLVDMPLNSSPVTGTAGGFHQKLKAAGGQLLCNSGFWGGGGPGNEEEEGCLSDRGGLGV